MPRKCHGKRFIAEAADGTTDADIWVEVLRMDRMTDLINAGGQAQRLIIDKWRDTNGNTSDNPARHMEKVDSTVNASGGTVYIEAIRSLFTMNSGQGARYYFFNGNEGRHNDYRKEVVKRVYSSDLESIDGVDVDWDSFPAKYQAAQTKAKANNAAHIDVAITVGFGRRSNAGGLGQWFLIRHKALLDVMEDAPGAADVRLDPFQIIVNFNKATPSGAVGLSVSFSFSVAGGSAINVTGGSGAIYSPEWFGVDHTVYSSGGSYQILASGGPGGLGLSPPMGTFTIINSFSVAGTTVSITAGFWRYHESVYPAYDPAYYELVSDETKTFSVGGVSIVVPDPQLKIPAGGGASVITPYWVGGTYTLFDSPPGSSGNFALDNSIPILVPASDPFVSLYFPVPKH